MNNVKLSAWSLKNDISRQIYPLYPPPEYIEVAQKLTQERHNISNRGDAILIPRSNSTKEPSKNKLYKFYLG
ncbi:MAG: hypothetical protein AB4080_23750 [Trichodesmium sp.]